MDERLLKGTIRVREDWEPDTSVRVIHCTYDEAVDGECSDVKRYLEKRDPSALTIVGDPVEFHVRPLTDDEERRARGRSYEDGVYRPTLFWELCFEFGCQRVSNVSMVRADGTECRGTLARKMWRWHVPSHWRVQIGTQIAAISKLQPEDQAPLS